MRHLVLVACLLLSACAQTVGEIYPRPNVFLAPSTQALGLRLGPEVPEQVHLSADLPEMLGMDLDVQRWRETLVHGFHAAFDPFFAKAGDGATLVLIEATPVVYSATRASSTFAVRYKAELVDGRGAVLQRFAGTAVSPQSINLLDNASQGVTGAVETLYERIAPQLPNH